VTRHGPSHRERAQEAAAARWHTYRDRLAEMSSVSQLAMVDEDIRAVPGRNMRVSYLFQQGGPLR
jgi:hypothetical protein